MILEFQFIHLWLLQGRAPHGPRPLVSSHTLPTLLLIYYAFWWEWPYISADLRDNPWAHGSVRRMWPSIKLWPTDNSGHPTSWTMFHYTCSQWQGGTKAMTKVNMVISCKFHWLHSMAWQNCPINIYFWGVVGVSERTRIIPNPGGAKNWHGFPTAIPNHSYIPWEAWRISRYWIPFKAGNYIELAWTSHPVGWPSYSMLLLLLIIISSFRPGLRLGVSPSILRCETSPEKSSTGSFSAFFEIIPIPCASVCFVDPLLFSLFFLVVPHSWLRASVYTMLFGTTLRVVWYVCVRVCVCALAALT